MRTFTYIAVVSAILAACTGRSSGDEESMAGTTEAVFQKELEQLQELATKDSLAPEDVEANIADHKRREDIALKELETSPHKVLKPVEIEAMLEAWLKDYIAAPNEAEFERIKNAMSTDAAITRWGDAHPDKRLNFQKRLLSARVPEGTELP